MASKNRKIIAAAAILFLLAAPVSADYLQSADEAYTEAFVQADEKGMSAAEGLRDYVYQSGAAKDVKAETRRLYLWNYMLDLEKQRYDYEQRHKTYVYEQSEKNPELDFLAREAYQSAERSNALQKEISQNEEYLKKLTDDKAVTAHAEALEAALVHKESRAAKIIADIFGIILLAAVIASALRVLRRYGKKHGLI